MDRAAKESPSGPADEGPGRAGVLVVPYPDGPLVVRGPVRLWDESGREIDVRRRAVALCRCGRSRLGPLCDGTHRAVGFRAPGRSAGGHPGR